MEAKTSGNEHLDPTTDDEMQLVGMFFEKATELYPDWKMGDRTDLAMAMIGCVKKWAHEFENSQSDPVRVVQLEENE